MADVKHSTLTGADLHEPKGVSTAAANTAYIANGAGSGTWSPIAEQGHVCIRATRNNETTNINNTFRTLTTLGATWGVNTPPTGGITHTSGSLAFADTGVYMIAVTLSATGSVAAINEYEMTLGIDTGSGFVPINTSVNAYMTVTTTNIQTMAFVCMPTVTIPGTVITVMLRRTEGSAQLAAFTANLTVHRV